MQTNQNKFVGCCGLKYLSVSLNSLRKISKQAKTQVLKFKTNLPQYSTTRAGEMANIRSTLKEAHSYGNELQGAICGVNSSLALFSDIWMTLLGRYSSNAYIF